MLSIIAFDHWTTLSNVMGDGWLADIRTSYDTVAVSYADLLRDGLADRPFLRAGLTTFADLVRAAGGGPVADVVADRDTSPRTCASWATPLASTFHQR